MCMQLKQDFVVTLPSCHTVSRAFKPNWKITLTCWLCLTMTLSYLLVHWRQSGVQILLTLTIISAVGCQRIHIIHNYNTYLFWQLRISWSRFCGLIDWTDLHVVPYFRIIINSERLGHKSFLDCVLHIETNQRVLTEIHVIHNYVYNIDLCKKSDCILCLFFFETLVSL